jgi:hypothetical protein
MPGYCARLRFGVSVRKPEASVDLTRDVPWLNSFGEAPTFEKTFRYTPPVLGEEAVAHPRIPGG